MSLKSLFDLTGRVAVVSGAAQGMGRAMALALADAGADLMLVDRNLEGAQRTGGEIAALGRKAVADGGDVSNIAEVRRLFARVDKEFGRIDVLGNVAGEGVLAPPETIT